MTHLVDTSVWHHYGSRPEVQRVVDGLVSRGALLTTCPAVISEYCFSARSPHELQELQDDMAVLYLLESDVLAPLVGLIQSALWSSGLVRAAGSIDTLVAAYSIHHNQTLVTLDADFLRIARALDDTQASQQLRVIQIKLDGQVVVAPSGLTA